MKKYSEIEKRLDPRFYALDLKSTDKVSNLPIKKLKALSLSIKSGITPKSKGSAYTTSDEGVPFIRSGDLTNYNSIDYNSILYIKKNIHKKMKSSSLQKNDLLIAIVGATIGKTAIFLDNNEANINQAIARVRFKSNGIHPLFILYFLKTPLGLMELDRIKRPVARANINLQEVGEILIPIPRPQIQSNIIKLMESGYKKEKILHEQAYSKLNSKYLSFTKKIKLKILFVISYGNFPKMGWVLTCSKDHKFGNVC